MKKKTFNNKIYKCFVCYDKKLVNLHLLLIQYNQLLTNDIIFE